MCVCVCVCLCVCVCVCVCACVYGYMCIHMRDNFTHVYACSRVYNLILCTYVHTMNHSSDSYVGGDEMEEKTWLHIH